MVDSATVRELALSLPEAVEQPHHGFPSFRVRAKIYATWPDPGHLNIMLAEQDIRQVVLAAPECCEEQMWGKKLSAVRVELAAIEPELLAELLRDAWKRRAPKKLLKKLEEEG